MCSRLLLNLALLLVAIGLTVLVLSTSKDNDEKPVTQLTELSPENTTRIELQRQSNNPVIFTREKGIWQMQAPYQLEANDYRVQSLLRLLQAEYLSQNPLGDRDPAQYGLDRPGSRLIFNDTLEIEFGETEPLSKQRYLRMDDHLYLVADTYYYYTISPVTSYLSHALLPDGRITAVSLPGLELVQKEGQWHMQPPKPATSADALTELVDNWRAAQALRLEAYQGPLPQADIQVTLDNREQPIRFSRQHKDGQLTLLRHDVRMRYVINDEIHDQLLQLPEPVLEPELDKKAAP